MIIGVWHRISDWWGGDCGRASGCIRVAALSSRTPRPPPPPPVPATPPSPLPPITSCKFVSANQSQCMRPRRWWPQIEGDSLRRPGMGLFAATDDGPAIVRCWASVADAGPTSNKRWVNAERISSAVLNRQRHHHNQTEYESTREIRPTPFPLNPNIRNDGPNSKQHWASIPHSLRGQIPVKTGAIRHAIFRKPRGRWIFFVWIFQRCTPT